MRASWKPWTLGRYFSDRCGGHSFMDHPVQLVDLRRQAEKAYRSSSILKDPKFQVVHHHGHGKNCDGCLCEAYGKEVPSLG